MKHLHSMLVLTFLAQLAQVVQAQNVVAEPCQQFTLNIHIINRDKKSVRLYYKDCANSRLNTVELVNGRAKFTGRINGAERGMLYTDIKNDLLDAPSVIHIILEPKEMFVSCSITDSAATNVVITGSKSQSEYEKWQKGNSATILSLKNWYHKNDEFNRSNYTDTALVKRQLNFRSGQRDSLYKILARNAAIL